MLHILQLDYVCTFLNSIPICIHILAISKKNGMLILEGIKLKLILKNFKTNNILCATNAVYYFLASNKLSYSV